MISISVIFSIFVVLNLLQMDKYKIFDDNLVLFNSILNDIKAAKQSVWIEIYRFGKDAMGEKFRMALEEKAKEGVEIKILVDAWGTGAETSFFEHLILQRFTI